MMTNRIPGSLVVLALTALLMSCGFQLRDGSYRLPDNWKQINIETRGSVSNKSGLSITLKKILQESHRLNIQFNIKPGMSNQRAKIILIDEKFRNPVSALDTLGRAQEYLLEYVVRFQFIGVDGKALAPVHRIYLRREQSYSSTSILAKERESEYLRKSLQQRAATQIVERLLALLR